MKKKIWWDSEFTGLHQKTTLISIGLISDCGKSFYAEFNDYDRSQVDEWIQKNVIDNLLFSEPPIGEDEHYIVTRHKDNPVGNNLYDSYSVELRNETANIKRELKLWLAQFESIEMWSDCLSYDWMLFCNIFGHAFNIPKNILYIPFDICTSMRDKGINPDIKREEFIGAEKVNEICIILNTTPEKGKHNSRYDAYVIRECDNKLNQ